MKNKIKLLGIIAIVAIIGFSFLSCEEDTIVEMTSATLTINGLSEYNGKDVIAYGYLNNTASFLAGRELTKKKGVVTVTYARVINGSATLQVWKANSGWNKFEDFSEPTGSQSVAFEVACIQTREDLEAENPGKDVWGVIGSLTVYFTGQGGNAVGSGTFAKGTGLYPSYPY